MTQTRRLAAILAADVAGYSRLMGADEEGTLERLKALRRELLDPKIAEHKGRIVKTTGDGLLVEFAARLAAERGSPVETTVPLQVVKAKLDGAHPLKAWREYRGITQAELASRSAVARDLIAQIETHKRQGSVATIDRLARTLGLPIEALIDHRG